MRPSRSLRVPPIDFFEALAESYLLPRSVQQTSSVFLDYLFDGAHVETPLLLNARLLHAGSDYRQFGSRTTFA